MTLSMCCLCQNGAVASVLDFGLQPICSRFLTNAHEKEYLHSLAIGQCTTCSLIQISNPVPVNELRPRYNWIVYREPEEHLDHLAAVISNLPRITYESIICGVSFVDESLLDCLKKRGFQQTWRIDQDKDLGINDTPAGVETIQAQLNANAARRIASLRQRPDVVIARYILEHAHDIREFLNALKTLVSPCGYIILEVPDCRRALENCDYSAIWEEHTLYFTECTFINSLLMGEFSIVRFEDYYYPLQNALVAIGTPRQEMGPSIASQHNLENEQCRWQTWMEGFAKKRYDVQKSLQGHRQRGGKIALYGAGQRGCTFINLLDLKGYIDFVVDDNTKKHGLFMPGSRLPIYGPSAILQEGTSLCLITARPESQDNVIQKHKAFLDQGGTFLSIYPDGQYVLPQNQW